MSANEQIQDVNVLTKIHDDKNLEIIQNAFDSGKIDEATRNYLTNLYTDSMDWFREVFLYIGKPSLFK